MNNELLLFTDKQGFKKAVEYAKSKGYNWTGWREPTFYDMVLDLPLRTKEYAINIFYNIYTGNKEIQYQTKAYYLVTEEHKTRFTNIKQF